MSFEWCTQERGRGWDGEAVAVVCRPQICGRVGVVGYHHLFVVEICLWLVWERVSVSFSLVRGW